MAIWILVIFLSWIASQSAFGQIKKPVRPKVIEGTLPPATGH